MTQNIQRLQAATADEALSRIVIEGRLQAWVPYRKEILKPAVSAADTKTFIIGFARYFDVSIRGKIERWRFLGTFSFVGHQLIFEENVYRAPNDHSKWYCVRRGTTTHDAGYERLILGCFASETAEATTPLHRHTDFEFRWMMLDGEFTDPASGVRHHLKRVAESPGSFEGDEMIFQGPMKLYEGHVEVVRH